MGLKEWLEEESKLHRFAIHLRNVRRVDSLERSENNKVASVTRVTATGEFQHKLMDDSVVVESVGKELTSLPLSVEFTFVTPQKMAENAAYGFLQFWKADNSADGIGSDPDALTLRILLPRNLLTRFAKLSKPPYLVVCLQGFDTVETGWMPGLSKLVWKDSIETHLFVKECALIREADKVESRDEEPLAEDSASPVETRSNTISLEPDLMKKAVVGFAILVILLLGVLAKL